MCPSGLPSSKWQISALGFFSSLPGQLSVAGQRPPTRITPSGAAVVVGVAVIVMKVIAAAKQAKLKRETSIDFLTVPPFSRSVTRLCSRDECGPRNVFQEYGATQSRQPMYWMWFPCRTVGCVNGVYRVGYGS